MTGITKQEAHHLAGNEFKLQDKEGKQWDITRVSPDWIDISRFEGGVYDQVVFYSQIGTDYFIICHPLSALRTDEYFDTYIELCEELELTQCEYLLKSYQDGSYYAIDNKKHRVAEKFLLERNFDIYEWQERGLTTEKLK